MCDLAFKVQDTQLNPRAPVQFRFGFAAAFGVEDYNPKGPRTQIMGV